MGNFYNSISRNSNILTVSYMLIIFIYIATVVELLVQNAWEFK